MNGYKKGDKVYSILHGLNTEIKKVMPNGVKLYLNPFAVYKFTDIALLIHQ